MKLTQKVAFERIRSLGLIVRKTDCNEYRVADPDLPYLCGTRENAAAYCGDLLEAVETAEQWFRIKSAAAKVAADVEADAARVKIRKPKTIDATPTWAAVLPLLCHALESATEEGKRIARAELERMATAADSFNALASNRAQ